jgi:DTW domain
MDTKCATEALACFLEKCSQQVRDQPANCVSPSSTFAARTQCDRCGASRSMYCFDCCRLLIPEEQRPDPLRENTLRLPFDVDLILDDRRSASTGVQLKALMDSMSDQDGNIRLFDMELNEEVPNYSASSKEYEGTYVLFPCSESIPLSDVVAENSPHRRIRRLVVLDCKWTRSSVRLDPRLAALSRVHLAADSVPKHSYYWRWHNAGQGMLSSAEAIYFGAWEVATADPSWTMNECQMLVYWMWIFGLQREVIAQRHYRDRKMSVDRGVPEQAVLLPFDEAAKEISRALHRMHKDRKVKLKNRKQETR